jgi:hypothetical protein
MQERNQDLGAVILGSFKPDKWKNIKESAETLSSMEVHVFSPRDVNLISIALPDNPDFYYLQGDLDEAGLTPKDLEGKTTPEILNKLDCRKLQTRVCRSMIKMGESGLTYVVLHNNELGKTTAYELSVAILFGNRVASNQNIGKISIEVNQEIRDFVEQTKSQIPTIKQENLKNSLDNFAKLNPDSLSPDNRHYLIRIALQSLLKKYYVPYDRPKDEFIEV